MASNTISSGETAANSNIGGANTSAVATNEPRIKAGIAASSGRSSGNSAVPSQDVTNGATSSKTPAARSKRNGQLPAVARLLNRPPSIAPNAIAARMTPMTFVQT